MSNNLNLGQAIHDDRVKQNSLRTTYQEQLQKDSKELVSLLFAKDFRLLSRFIIGRMHFHEKELVSGAYIEKAVELIDAMGDPELLSFDVQSVEVEEREAKVKCWVNYHTGKRFQTNAELYYIKENTFFHLDRIVMPKLGFL
jgi:hypothetical protein